MVTDNQIRMLITRLSWVNYEKLLKTAAAKVGMSEKTARKYRKSDKLPSQCDVRRIYSVGSATNLPVRAAGSTSAHVI